MKRTVPVESAAQLKLFIDFPHELYKGDPNYVPELFIAQRDLLSPKKHPFHKHSSLQLFLAFDEQEVVGRIASILNNNHNDFNKTNDGFFGFFDCINDGKVAKLLFVAAEEWLKDKKINRIIGPVNFSTNETCGLLVEGFTSPPYAMMTYNAPYYLDLVEKQGYHKQTDLLAYEFVANAYNERALKLRQTLDERLAKKGITIRQINLKDFTNEANRVREIYNQAWDRNLGFVPMTKEEFDYLAKDLKLVLDPAFCLIAEHEGKPVGFGLAIPDINQILIKVKRGRLLPTGIFKLLLGKSKINRLRIIALGVTEPYRKMGIEGSFYGAFMKRFSERNMQHAEASWILEDNTMMRLGIENINGKVYKRYRIFEKTV
jgi:GNAT superfamily N-acetyltransferase